jgi:hypothetical protein
MKKFPCPHEPGAALNALPGGTLAVKNVFTQGFQAKKQVTVAFLHVLLYINK